MVLSTCEYLHLQRVCLYTSHASLHCRVWGKKVNVPAFWLDYLPIEGPVVYACYHPAALLRQTKPEDQAKILKAMSAVAKVMGLGEWQERLTTFCLNDSRQNVRRLGGNFLSIRFKLPQCLLIPFCFCPFQYTFYRAYYHLCVCLCYNLCPHSLEILM